MRLQLPGYRLGLNVGTSWCDFASAYPSARHGKGFPLTTLREFLMVRLMNQFTDEVDWETKVFDPEITRGWKEKALATPDADITEAMVDWCIAETQFKARFFQKTKMVIVYMGDVVKSDAVIPEAMRLALIDAVKPLEDELDCNKTLAPHSDGTVVALVDPSLFPLVFGKTRILPERRTTLDNWMGCEDAEVLPVPRQPPSRSSFDYWQSRWVTRPYSIQFQWLPCEVDISSGQPKIASYINNLHPHRHKEVYSLINQIIGYAIPLWNLTLSSQRTDYHVRLSYTKCQYDPDPATWPVTEGPQREPDDDMQTYWLRRQRWIQLTRRVVQPEVGIYRPPIPNDQEVPYEDDQPYIQRVNLRKEYGTRGLQLIVKLENIVLTPDKPRHPGGTWHIVGQLNEHICAAAMYCYSSSNITTPHITFRQHVDQDVSGIEHQYGEYDWFEQVFGCSIGTSPIQSIGSVEMRQGRLLSFPNTLQHKLDPFELVDPTKLGHQKILCLYLVDPQTRVISTQNVPCQRLDWWKDAVLRWNSFDNGDEDGRRREGTQGSVGDMLSSLPVELQDRIFDLVEDFPVTMEEGKVTRLEVIKERLESEEGYSESFIDGSFRVPGVY